jgi:hypothetical protein
METVDWAAGGFPFFLARLPPFADLFRMRWVADIDDDGEFYS